VALRDGGRSAVEAQEAETLKGRKLARNGSEWGWLVENFEPMKGEEEELKDAREDVEAMIENTLTILVFPRVLCG